LGDHQRFTIDAIAEDGQPIEPRKHANTFVRQCGVIVRDNVPITVREWHKTKNAEDSYVDQRAKDTLWEKLLAHFKLPEQCDISTEDGLKWHLKVKEWALKKMAEQFRNHKKRLRLEFVNQNKTPDFKGPLEKIREQWPDFVKYCKSSVATDKSAKNKENAKKKGIPPSPGGRWLQECRA
jgi:hypothetical protein